MLMNGIFRTHASRVLSGAVTFSNRRPNPARRSAILGTGTQGSGAKRGKGRILRGDPSRGTAKGYSSTRLPELALVCLVITTSDTRSTSMGDLLSQRQHVVQALALLSVQLAEVSCQVSLCGPEAAPLAEPGFVSDTQTESSCLSLSSAVSSMHQLVGRSEVYALLGTLDGRDTAICLGQLVDGVAGFLGQPGAALKSDQIGRVVEEVIVLMEDWIRSPASERAQNGSRSGLLLAGGLPH
jgi:hypothetical protein